MFAAHIKPKLHKIFEGAIIIPNWFFQCLGVKNKKYDQKIHFIWRLLFLKSLSGKFIRYIFSTNSSNENEIYS